MNNSNENSVRSKNMFTRIITEFSEFYKEYKIQRPFTSKAVTLIILGVLLSIILLFAHKSVIYSEAIAADDSQYVFQNNLVRNPSWNSVKQFFSEVTNPSTVMGYYQPLAMISLMIDVSLGGSQDNMYIFHITSLCIHILNSFLVLLLLYLMFKKFSLAFAGGILFGIHPVCIEEIAWISERKSILATFFLLSSLILYILYVKYSKKKFLVASIFAFTLALLSKPIAVSLPIILVLFDYFWFKRLRILTLSEKIPYFILAAVFTLIAYISQKNTAAIQVLPQSLNIIQLILLICYINIFYLWKLLIPTDLSPHYDFISPISLSNLSFLVPAILTIILIVVFVLTYRHSKKLLFGYLFYIVSILPTSGILRVTNSIACYKYAYFPSVGILICFIILIKKITQFKLSHMLKYSIAIILVLIISFGEIVAVNSYSSKWKNTETLYKHITSINPNSYEYLDYLGREYYSQGKIDKAIEYYNQALSINPSSAETYMSLATALFAKEQYDNALSLYDKALDIGLPRNSRALAYYNKGLIYDEQQNYEKAIIMFEESIKINPNLLSAKFDLAIVLSKLDKYEEAVSICKEIIDKYPNNELGYAYLGILYSTEGNYKEAVKQLSISIDKNPNNSFSYHMLGNILANDNKYNEASMCYEQAIKLNPNNVRIYNDYSKLMAQQGKFEEGIEILEKAIKILPNSDTYNLLGMMHEDLQKYNEAYNYYQKAYEINPENEEIQSNLNNIKHKIN